MRLRTHGRPDQRRSIRLRTCSAVAAAAAVLSVAAPVAGAAAAATPAPSAATPAPCAMPSGLVFTPPSVGPRTVDIGPTIINGKVIDPGLHVFSAGISLPPMACGPIASGPTG